MAAAARPQFPPGHIEFDHLVPGTIYKFVQITPDLHGWAFTRFRNLAHFRNLGHTLVHYEVWTNDPDPRLAYQTLTANTKFIRFYPIGFDTGAIPRIPDLINPPFAELVARISRAALRRRMHALAAWSRTQYSNSNTRRRSNRRRSTRRSSRRNHRK